MKKTVIIIVILLILGAVGGGYLYVAGQSADLVTSPLQPTPGPQAATPTASIIQADTKQIKEVSLSFYTAYSECLKTPPQPAKGKVSLYCQANTGLTTENFPQNLKDGGTARAGADPITCSQNPPGSVVMGEVDFEDPEHAVVIAIADFGGNAQKIPVQMLLEETKWKVDSVVCPRP